MEFFIKYWDLILSGISLAISVIFTIIYYSKRFKNAKSDEERHALIEELKTSIPKMLNVDKTIEEVKKDVPVYMSTTDALFASIPDSLEFKVEHVLKMIKDVCDTMTTNVFEEYDWREYVKGLYEEKSKEVG